MYFSKLEKSWLDSRISHELVSLLANEVSNIIAPNSITTTNEDNNNIPPLHDFIDLITQRSRTKTGTLIIAFILLNRLSFRLGYIATTGMASAPQRIFLASLIISTKLINDTSPKNKHWMTFANDYFELDEINLMEKQFLTLMDFNLSITENDFQQAVNQYKQLQKYKRRHSMGNHHYSYQHQHQQLHHHHHHHQSNTNNKNSNTKRKSNNNNSQWQGTPDYLVTPVRNVASMSNKNATLTRSSSSTLTLSSSSSSSSSSSIIISASSSSSSSSSSSLLTPSLYEVSLSNSSSSSTLQSHSPSSPMDTISLHNNDSYLKWNLQHQQPTTKYISPIYSS